MYEKHLWKSDILSEDAGHRLNRTATSALTRKLKKHLKYVYFNLVLIITVTRFVSFSVVCQ